MMGANLSSTMRKPLPPPGFDSIKREEQSRLFGRVAYLRVWVVPIILGFLLWMEFYPTTPWRRFTLLTLGLVASFLFLREAFIHRRHGFRRRALPLNLVGAAFGHSIACFATSGLGSPFLFALFPILMVGVLVLEPMGIFVMAGVQVTAVWSMLAVEVWGVLPNWNLAIFGGGTVAGWNTTHLVWNAIFLTAGILVTLFLGRSVRGAFEGMIFRGLTAQSELLETHRERASELASLSAEIAHELKNPLASIKGLAGLLQQNIVDEKGAERLSVLRREVDRMQAILGDFLNYSRPILPLAKKPVALDLLLDEVMALHEGVAHERGITLLRKGSGGVRVCDERKVKQVLINVLQNALEASPAGSRIELGVLPDGTMEIRDEGMGLPSEIAAQVFKPGVTSKSTGSGLGLTIAQAIMRQHAGQLTLSPGEGGGTVVAISLPDEKGPACAPVF